MKNATDEAAQDLQNTKTQGELYLKIGAATWSVTIHAVDKMI